MIVLDVIALACKFTANGEIASALEDGTLTDAQEEKVADFVKCFNLVQDELATEYIPIEERETLGVTDRQVLFSAFSFKPVSVISVKSGLKKIKFKVLSDRLVLQTNLSKVSVTYTRGSSELALSDEIEDALVPLRVYAYGVAREYFLLEALSDEADIFEQRFKGSLEVIKRKRSGIVMPKRRWI